MATKATTQSKGSSTRRPARPAEAAAKRSTPAEKPAAPSKPAEALSLIEPSKPVRRQQQEGAAKSRSILPPISRIRARKEDEEKAAADKTAQAEAQAPAAKKAEVLDLISAREKPKPAEAAPAPVSEPEAEISVEGETSASDEELKVIHIKPPIVVKDLAAQMGLRPFQVIKDLMEIKIFAAINQTIEPDVAAKICQKHGFIFEKERREKGAGVHKAEPVVVPPPPPEVKKEDDLKPRPPIITFMGHVDHGKTSLMDAIRKTRVAAGEAGGITQHIGAYSVDFQGKPITFLDTPGHAAFTAMRARGANVTDIVVLVVAADDGIMPQTVEAINHAKAANVKIIVAINKIDLPQANVDRVKTQLQEQGLVPDDWGGNIVCCPVSATKGTGLDNLLEMMNLTAEMEDYRSSPETDARCTVIEAQMEPGRGPTGTVIVRIGTLKTGQAFICGNHYGKVKMMLDDLGKSVKQAGPATPVKVLGFSGLPSAGDELVVMSSERDAKALSEERLLGVRNEKLTAPQRATLESLFQNIEEGQKKALRIVLKADVQGSMEALVTSLNQIESRKIDLDVIHSAVGPITESDVLLASASDAVVIGFGVKTESKAADVAKSQGVQIKLYSIIYELLDQVKEAMTGLLDPELRETTLGHAEVKQVFKLSKGLVAGCIVTDGRIVRTARARVLRRKQPIYDGGVATLRRFQDDVKEVRNGLECGIKLGDFSEYEAGDIIECYQLEKVAQTL